MDEVKPAEPIKGIKGYLLNCTIESREGDEILFECDDGGRVIAYLDSYAIIPIEKLNAMEDRIYELLDREGS